MSSIGDTVGYTIVQRRKGSTGGWDETPAALHDTIAPLIGILDRYEEDNPRTEYAVVRLQIVVTTIT